MLAFYERVKSAYRSHQHQTISRSVVKLAETERMRLKNEMSNNTYTLPTLLDVIKTAETYTCFDAPTIQLRVLGVMTSMDHMTCMKVCQRVSCIQSIYPTSPSRLVVWLFLTPAKRYMPSQGSIQPIHINGGYTYVRGNEIFVLRREEFPKVILHEVIHHTKLHFPTWDSTSIKELYQYFNISQAECSATMHTCSTRLEPNEAVVETWAEMFHMAFISIELGIPFKKVRDMELDHAFEQSKKLIRHQMHVMPNMKWSEGSHSYAYIIFRTILLLTFDKWHAKPDTRMITRLIVDTANTQEYQSRFTKKANISSNPTSLRMTWFGDL